MIGGNVLDGRYVAGLIDEVAYYPRVLSNDRIIAHFRAGSSSATAVPTLGAGGLAGLIAFLGLVAVWSLRRQRS